MITDTDKVLLPIGLEIDGVRYREVIIDEMTGIDEENLTSRKVRNNGAKAITMLLRRCIQSIEGVLERKSNPLSLIDEKWVKNMYVADRDFLVLCIRGLSGDNEIMVSSNCGECGEENNHLVDIKDMDVYEWDENEPAEINIELIRGFHSPTTGEYHNKVNWVFPKGKAQEQIASYPEHQVGTYLIASGIKDVEGMPHCPSAEEVRRLSVRDRNVFAKAIVDNMVGVDTNHSVCCEFCGADYNVEVSAGGFSNLGSQTTPKRSNAGISGRRLRKKR